MRAALAVLCGGVVSCSILSGASELTVGGGEGPIAAPDQDASSSVEGGAVADAPADGVGPLPDAKTGPPAGSVDTTFGVAGRVLVNFGAAEAGHDATLDPDGSIVVGGRSGSGIPSNFAVARLTAKGDLDPTFGNGGKVTLDFVSDYDEVNGLARQSDGRYLATGRCWSAASGGFLVAAARFDASGALDASYGNAGRVEAGPASSNNQDGTFALVLRPGDAPVVAGSANGNVALTAFLANGSLDPTPGGTVTGAAGVVRSLARQTDGKLVLAGFATAYTSATSTDVIVERRNADLSLDTSFGVAGRATVNIGVFDHAYAVAIAPGGAIVVAGDTGMVSGSEDVLVLRFTANGTLDTSFGQGGHVITPIGPASSDRGRAVAIDGSGRILVAGSTTAGTDQDVLLLRYDATGVLDPTFGNKGVVAPAAAGIDEARDLRFAADGRIVIVGTGSNGVDSDMLVQRFWP